MWQWDLSLTAGLTQRRTLISGLLAAWSKSNIHSYANLLCRLGVASSHWMARLCHARRFMSRLREKHMRTLWREVQRTAEQRKRSLSWDQLTIATIALKRLLRSGVRS